MEQQPIQATERTREELKNMLAVIDPEIKRLTEVKDSQDGISSVEEEKLRRLTQERDHLLSVIAGAEKKK